MDPQTNNCWFCNRVPAVDARAERVELYGNVVGSPAGLMSYDTKTVVIPRCPACARAHTWETWLGILAFLVGGLAGIILCAAVSDWFARISGWGVLVGILFVGFGLAGGIVGVLVGSVFSKPLLGARRSGTETNDYPEIRELVSRGWKVGSAPSEVEATTRRAA